MDSVFEGLFFLAVGLLGITVTIFVLSISLLGRAIKQSMQEKAEMEEKQKKDIDENIKEIKNKLDEAASSGHTDIEKLQKSFTNLKKRQNKYETKLNYIQTKPFYLRVEGGVLLPGACFLVSILASLLGRYQFSNQFVIDAMVTADYVTAIFFILIGIVLIYQTLKVVEGVAITSEEAAFTREAEALKKALVEYEESKKTELNLKIVNPKSPFKFKADSRIDFTFDITIIKGLSAKNPEICIWLPRGFNFLRESEPLITREGKYADYISFKEKLPDFQAPYGRYITVGINTPKKTGSYKGACRLNCEGFVGIISEFEIIVD